MKKLLLKSMLLLSALIVGSSSVWADTYNSILAFDCAEASANVGSSSEISTASGLDTFLEYAAGTTNKITVSSSPSKVYGAKGSGGSGIPNDVLKVGTASGAGSFSFSIDNSYSKIDRVVITGYGWKNTSKIAVNGSATQSPTTAATETAFTFDLEEATRSFSIAVTTSAVCITSIELFEKEVVSGEATSVTIDASGIITTDIASGTAAGSFSAVVKDASSNTIDAASVTWTSSKPSVATINSTGEVTLVKKGTTTITASYAGVDGTYQPSSNTYVLNVTNSAANDGTSAKPFTVTEARDALDVSEIDAETIYYVKGCIAKIGALSADGQLTYWISDDGSMTNNIQCYKGKNVGGVAFAAATDLEIGDIATIKGKLKIYETTTYEFDENNEVVSITPRTKVNIATFTVTTNPLILGVTATTETSVTNDQAGWTPASYTYESDDETVATVDANGVITAVAKGTANITVTPDVSATNPSYKVGASKSLEITVSNPSHTASFSVNGVIDPSDNDVVEEGEDITFPADPADIGDKKFVGWAEAIIDGTTDVAPTFVESATMGIVDVTYYAVFASSSTGTVTKTDVINCNVTGVTGTSYSGWSGKQAENGSSAVYAGQCAGSNNTVQLRTSGGVEGVVATTTGGTVKRVVVDWHSSTSNGRTLNIYGKNSAYSFENTGTDVEVSELFNDSKQGTLLGTIVKGTSTELTITGDYAYIGIRSASSALYCNSISIDWETTGIVNSAYCTSIPSSVPVTITSTSGFATLYTGYALDFSSMSSELKAYTATISENTVTLTEVNDIPANTGVVLKGDVKTHNVPVAASSSTAKGDLTGNTSAATAYNAFSGYDLYMLALNGNNEAQFTKATSGSIAAGKAFLKLSSGAGARELNVVFADDDVTGISTMHNE